MLGGRYKEVADWNSETNQGYISELRDWMLDHQDAADSLMNIDYTQFRNFGDIKFDEVV